MRTALFPIVLRLRPSAAEQPGVSRRSPLPPILSDIKKGACQGAGAAVLAFALAAGLGGCAGPEATAPETTGNPVEAPATPEPETTVAVTTHGVEFLARSLTEDLPVELLAILPPDGDPAHGTPLPEHILKAQEADLILTHGLGYEVWLNTASLPISKVIATADKLDTLELPGQTHSHGDEGEHSHRGRDPRTWLDPMLFRDQARATAKALKSAYPDWADTVDTNLEELEGRLTELDELLQDLLGSQDSLAASSDLAYWSHRFDLPKLDPASPPALGLTTAHEAEVAKGATDAPESRIVVLDSLDQSPDGPLEYERRFKAMLEDLRAALAEARQGAGTTVG